MTVLWVFLSKGFRPFGVPPPLNATPLMTGCGVREPLGPVIYDEGEGIHSYVSFYERISWILSPKFLPSAKADKPLEKNPFFKKKWGFFGWKHIFFLVFFKVNFFLCGFATLWVKKSKTWVCTVKRHGVVAYLMASSDANNLPLKYEANSNPEHVLGFALFCLKTFLQKRVFFQTMVLLMSKKRKYWQIFHTNTQKFLLFVKNTDF